LIDRYGEAMMPEIEEVYTGALTVVAVGARINFNKIPELAYKHARDILRAMVDEGYLERKLEKMRKKEGLEGTADSTRT